jgi:hypothetical protein
MFALSVILVSLGVPMDQSALSLALNSPKREVLVGEPVKLVLQLKARKRTDRVDLDGDDIPFSLLSVVVDNGGSTRTYVEYNRTIEERVRVYQTLEAGDERAMNLVLFCGGYRDSPGSAAKNGVVFPAPGRYSIKVRYSSERHHAESNSLWFVVGAPPAEDRQILEAARHEPCVLGASGDREAQAKARELVDKYPNSPYLRWAKLRQLEQTSHNADSNLERNLGREVLLNLHRYDRAGLAAHRRGEFERITKELLDPSVEWFPFEEEALAVGMLAALAADRRETAADARTRLLEEYPDSPTARRQKATEKGKGGWQ